MSNKRENPEQNNGHSTVSLNIEAGSSSDLNMAEKEKADKNMENAESKKGKEDTKNTVPFHKLFRLADTLDITLMSIATVASIANGLTYPLITILLGSVMNAFGQNNVQEVSKVALDFVYLAACTAIASFFQMTFWIYTGERQAACMRSFYLKTILGQDIAFFDIETSTGEVIGRMSGDTVLIQDAMGEKVGKFIQLISTFLGGFVVAFIRGWKLTLVLLCIIPLLALAGGAIARITSMMASRGQQAYAEAGNVVEQTIGAIRTVASFNGEKNAVTEYEKSLTIAYKVDTHQGLAAGFGIGSGVFILFCGYALAFWYGSHLVINEGYSGGSVINIIIALLVGGLCLALSSPCLSAFGAGQAAAYKMFETIDRKPEIDVYDTNGLVLEDIQGDLELKDVHFSYPARPDVQIFSGFSLEIPRGTTAALVGESGSGKSTVISLIERFYDPQAGEVLIDSVNIKQFQLKWIRQKIGLVSQEPALFATTIKENIAYGKDGATTEEIQAAAELANAAKFISNMPQGFDTMVGEHGNQLSGGQKQRIAIARAILKDPRILLLDEATSALDAESERLVQEALDKVMINRTTVIVAHRLTTVRNADMIAVVQRGCIVEKGTHSQLIVNPCGAFSQLIRLQETHPSKEQYAADSEEMEIQNVHDSRSIGSSGVGTYPSKENLHANDSEESRESSPRRSSGVGDSHNSLSFLFSLPAVVALQEEDVQLDESEPKKRFMNWFSSKRRGDVEDGQSKVLKDVSLLRLASLNKPEAPVLIVGSIAAAVNGTIYPIFGLLLSIAIANFYEPPHKLRKDANFWSLMFSALAATCLLVCPIQMYCFGIAGGKLVQRIRSLTFDKVVYQEIGWFDNSENSSGAISARLSTDAATVRSVVGDALGLVVQNISTIVAGLVIAFSANWKLAFLILALLPLIGLQGWVQAKLMVGFSGDTKVMYEKASQVANDAIGSIRTVASFCAEDKVMGLYNDKCSAPLKRGVQQAIISGLSFAIANFIMCSVYAFCFWLGSVMVEHGAITFGNVLKVFFTFMMTALVASNSLSMAPNIANVKSSVNSIFKILDQNSKIDASDALGTTLENVKGHIEFQHVNFKYPTRPDIQIFRDLSITFCSRKTIALVGESGSGKSTIISLLERFYDPHSGRILLDGVEIQKLQIKWLRQQMGLVIQEPILFNDSIRANIAYGKDGLVSDEQIVIAAEASNAHKFILDLPQGYNTCVGERGVQLSGGQKQRVAIARAIIKDPMILLLDEATSALDVESERIVQDALDHVMVNRTTIVVAHRLSTIKKADLIVVMKNGVIAEQGKHDELLATRDGAYASLVKLYMASSSLL